MTWRVLITRPAEKDLAKLPSRDAEAMRRALRELTDDPGATDLKKLAGGTERWRLRVGSWRAILKLDNSSGEILVLNVYPRSRAYRD